MRSKYCSIPQLMLRWFYTPSASCAAAKLKGHLRKTTPRFKKITGGSRPRNSWMRETSCPSWLTSTRIIFQQQSCIRSKLSSLTILNSSHHESPRLHTLRKVSVTGLLSSSSTIISINSLSRRRLILKMLRLCTMLGCKISKLSKKSWGISRWSTTTWWMNFN